MAEKIMEHFSIMFEEAKMAQQDMLRIRYLSLIRKWVEKYYHDFREKEVRQQLVEALDTLAGDASKCKSIAKESLSILDAKLKQLHEEEVLFRRSHEMNDFMFAVEDEAKPEHSVSQHAGSCVDGAGWLEGRARAPAHARQSSRLWHGLV